MPLNYDKWKKIEISDDEDDVHPNIDTPSLFRWRHKARLERMEEHKVEKERIADKLRQLMDEKPRLAEEEFEKRMLSWKQENEQFAKLEASMPWNVDTISKEKFSKTIINKEVEEADKEDSEESTFVSFIEKYESEIKSYGMLRKYADSERFLVDNSRLVCEATANYLVVWCIDMEMEGKHSLMEHVARQAIILQFILEVGKSAAKDPRACVRPFFAKIAVEKNVEAIAGFTEELAAFIERIRQRAKEKLEKLQIEYEEEEKKKRLGPGGLDPVEVMESLPETLKKCFETLDIELLKQTIAQMSEEDARYHIDRCIKSGLWVPGGASDNASSEKQ